MFYVSEIFSSSPSVYKTELQKKTYETLKKLNIPFERVDTDEAITMEDCTKINERLDMKMVKTLFLCNRQQTLFYLFITTADKPFSSKNFSNALNVSRISFAPAELMDKMLGTTIGATTVFSVLLDPDRDIQIVFDKDVEKETWYGCSDGTTTGYMKIRTSQIIDTFLPYTKHKPILIDL